MRRGDRGGNSHGKSGFIFFFNFILFILIISRLAETKTTSERLAAEAESAATERGTAGGKSVILFLALFPEGVSNKSSPLLSHPQALAVSTIKKCAAEVWRW